METLKAITQEVKGAKLPGKKESEILKAYGPFVELVQEWTERAKTIEEPDIDDEEALEIVREVRLSGRAIRVEVENVRKGLKEDPLQINRTIDSVAKTLKALVTPLEERLKLWENKPKTAIEEAKAKRVESRKEELEGLGISEYNIKDLETMSDEAYEAYRDKKAQDYREAAREYIEVVGGQRNDLLEKYKYPEGYSFEDLAEMDNGEWHRLIEEAKALRLHVLEVDNREKATEINKLRGYLKNRFGSDKMEEPEYTPEVVRAALKEVVTRIAVIEEGTLNGDAPEYLIKAFAQVDKAKTLINRTIKTLENEFKSKRKAG